MTKGDHMAARFTPRTPGAAEVPAVAGLPRRTDLQP